MSSKRKPKLGIAPGQLDLLGDAQAAVEELRRAADEVGAPARKPPAVGFTRPRAKAYPLAGDTIGADSTVAQARAWVDQRTPIGCECPVCHQYARRYRRQVNSAMATALILFFRWHEKHPGEWLHVPTFIAERHLPAGLDAALRGGDFAKLRFWGLIESKPGEIRSDDSDRAGIWRITALGTRFVRDEVTIKRYALVYNNHVTGSEGSGVTIKECLGKRFSYDELMQKG